MHTGVFASDSKNENDSIRFSATNDSIQYNQLHVIW